MIEFYSVFDGLENELITPDKGLMKNIKKVYLENYASIKKNFIYEKDTLIQEEMENVLIKLARGDRKRYSIYKNKDISQPLGRKVYRKLFENAIIEQEISREEPLKEEGKLLKKSLRHYTIDNKIHFCQESTRFYFTFIAPNKELIKNKEFDKVLDIIQNQIDKFISLTFELLSAELMEKILPPRSIISSGSYWSKNHEIDLLIYTKDEKVIVGEVKWKNRKICKNVLNSLQRKASLANLGVSHFALFSKSGFSKEVAANKYNNVMLFSMEDFKRLYHDR